MNKTRTIKQTLEIALTIVENPKQWTRGAYARQKNGDPINPIGNKACCWCALGALIKADGDQDNYLKALYALNDASMQYRGISPNKLNDLGSHAEVIEMFKRAIRSFEA